MNLKSSLIAAFTLICAVPLFSKNIYIQYDPACMDRLEYRLNGNMAGNGLISYSLKANDSERVVMEIGVESIKQVKRLPRGTKTCGKIKADELLANSINSGKDKVYIVRRVGKYYLVSPVHLATYMKDAAGTISMRSNQLDMTYATTDIGVMENNLANRNSTTKVFYLGTEQQACSNAILLKKIPEETCKPFTDMTFVPGIGVIEERIGLTQSEAENNRLQLVKVNNIPLADYMAKKCAGEDLAVATPTPMQTESPVLKPATTKRPAEKPAQADGFEVVFPLEETAPVAPEYRPAGSELVYEYDQPQRPLETFRPRGIDCKKLSYPGVHIIQENQTLYGISRQYGVTVNQLRTWNKMGDKDIIQPCESLYVLPPNNINDNVSAAATQPNNDLTARGGKNAEILFPNTKEAPASAMPSVAQNTAPTSYSAPSKVDALYNDAAKQTEILFPKTASASPQPKAAVAQNDCKKLPYDGVHIVQKGETLYSIAVKNDLTVKQLQQWNDLNDKSKIQPCMSLYTKTPASVIAAINKPQNDPAPEASYTIPNNEIGTGYTNAPDNPQTPTPTATTNEMTPKGGSAKMWNSGIEYHVVQKGETLMSLAKMYGFTVERFRDINGLGDSNIIRIGQVLRTGNCLCPADGVGPTNLSQPTSTTKSATTNPTTAVGNTNNGNGQITSGGEEVVTNKNNSTTVQKGTASTANRTVERSTEYTPVPAPYDYETESILNTSKRSQSGVSYRNGRKVHTVKENETMASIANTYDIPVDLLRKLNKMEKNEIVIPDMKIYLE